jgi:hypothetical protein
VAVGAFVGGIDVSAGGISVSAGGAIVLLGNGSTVFVGTGVLGVLQAGKRLSSMNNTTILKIQLLRIVFSFLRVPFAQV